MKYVPIMLCLLVEVYYGLSYENHYVFTPIQTAYKNFLPWWFACDFLIFDNLAYQKCFVSERLFYSSFIFTVIFDVYWMNRWVFAQGFFFVWLHFNVFKGDTQTKTLKRVFSEHIQSAFSSIHVFFWKKIASNYVTFSYRHFPFFFFFSRYWHHSWHNNRLRRLTGLWGKYRLLAVFLFLQIKWEQCTRAGAAKPRYARNEGGSLFRLAPSVTRVAICVSRVLLDGLQKKERLFFG